MSSVSVNEAKGAKILYQSMGMQKPGSMEHKVPSISGSKLNMLNGKGN